MSYSRNHFNILEKREDTNQMQRLKQDGLLHLFLTLIPEIPCSQHNSRSSLFISFTWPMGGGSIISDQLRLWDLNVIILARPTWGNTSSDGPRRIHTSCSQACAGATSQEPTGQFRSVFFEPVDVTLPSLHGEEHLHMEIGGYYNPGFPTMATTKKSATRTFYQYTTGWICFSTDSVVSTGVSKFPYF